MNAFDTYGFDANGFTLSTVEVVGATGQFFEVHVLVRVHLAAVDLHDTSTSLGERRASIVCVLTASLTVSFG